VRPMKVAFVDDRSILFAHGFRPVLAGIRYWVARGNAVQDFVLSEEELRRRDARGPESPDGRCKSSG